MRVLRLLSVCVLLGVATAAGLGAHGENPPQVLVSRQLAELHQFAIGDVVRLGATADGAGARTFQIAGIYEPTPDPMRLGDVRHEVRLHLPDLLELTRPPDVPAGAEHVEAINLALVNPDDGREIADIVAARMPGIQVSSTVGGGRNAAAFVVLERFHLAIALVTIIAATVFLLALSIMLVDERRETVGVLRLIGLPRRRILSQVLLEGVLIAGVGTLFGLGLAVTSQGLINWFFQLRYDTALVFVEITPTVALTCIAISVPLGAGATVAASWVLLRRSGLRLARR